MDARIVKTDKKIKTAFIKLLGNNKFEQITVSGICKEAKVNRATFYLHYTDKYDLLERLENETILDITQLKNNIVKQFSLGTFPFFDNKLMIQILTDFYKGIDKNAVFIRNILSVNGNLNFQYQLQKYATKLIIENLGSMSEKIAVQIPINYLAAMVAEMQLGILKEWLNNNQKEAPEELARMVAKIYMIMGQNLLHKK